MSGAYARRIATSMIRAREMELLRALQQAAGVRFVTEVTQRLRHNHYGRAQGCASTLEGVEMLSRLIPLAGASPAMRYRAVRVALMFLLLLVMAGAAATIAAGRPSSEGRGLGATPQCSDGVDNQDREDALADEQDPGCHSDGDAANPDSYDPDDRSEQDTGKPGPAPSPTPTPTPTSTPTPERGHVCRASALRVDSVEPLVANAAGRPCRSGEAGAPSLALPPVGSPLLYLEGPRATTTRVASSASVAKFELWDPRSPTEPLVRAELLSASADCNSDAVKPSGESTVASLTIDSTTVDLVGATQREQAVGDLATVFVNQEKKETDSLRGGDRITRRALFIDTHGELESLVGDVVVAEAVCERDPRTEGGNRGH